MTIHPSSRQFCHFPESEITPLKIYQSRRQIIQGLAAGVGGLVLTGWGQREAMAQQGSSGALIGKATSVSGGVTMDKPTPYKDAVSYNNFYEFGTDKSDPARKAHTLKTDPWSIEIEGLVKKPGRYHLEDLMKWGAMEERIYRLRCVEGWSMV
ncbi:MAG: Sulfoxide reductase catalytic subunit YedY precursor, partial [Pseudomonadota bacterium]